MNTKGAIEFLREAKKDLFREGAILKVSRIYDDIPKVIVLLQRGEKFEAMWKELENMDIEYKVDSPYVNDTMYYIEQKYFPK